MKICHITTVHPVFDTRIFLKECKSLSKHGFEVHLVSQHNKDEVLDNINIHGLPKPKSRIDRFFNLRKIAFRKAVKINADIYHFHDPELIPVGLKLKKLGKKVIYDVHEDVPRQILGKPYLNKFIKPIMSKTFELYENWAAKKFDCIITATPHIRDRFLEIGCKNVIDVQNMPILSEFSSIVHNWESKEKAVCYVGGISEIRGVYEMVESVKNLPDVKLYLAGPIGEEVNRNVFQQKNVIYLGYLNRDEISELFKRVYAGLVLLRPTKNYLDSLPVKMFEYMSAGLPVIASNFPLWKEIIEGNNCGLCVNPLDPEEIAKAIEYIITHPKEAEQMGQNGKKAVLEKYNWDVEERKLLKVYKELLK